MADSDRLALGLDDIIQLDRSKGNRRGMGRGGNRGMRNRPTGATARPNNNFNGFRTRGGGGMTRTSNPPAGRWKHDLYEDDAGAPRLGQRTGGVNSTTKLIVSNLDFGVTTNDIEELFSDVGAVRAAHVHYDENGRSLGTAEVVFERRVDALAAQKKYQSVNLDGRPMDIKIIGAEQQTTRPLMNTRVSGGNPRAGTFRNNNNRSGPNRGPASTRLGQQNGTKSNGKADNVTMEDLDADLEAYRAASGVKK